MVAVIAVVVVVAMVVGMASVNPVTYDVARYVAMTMRIVAMERVSVTMSVDQAVVDCVDCVVAVVGVYAEVRRRIQNFPTCRNSCVHFSR